MLKKEENSAERIIKLFSERPEWKGVNFRSFFFFFHPGPLRNSSVCLIKNACIKKYRKKRRKNIFGPIKRCFLSPQMLRLQWTFCPKKKPTSLSSLGDITRRIFLDMPVLLSTFFGWLSSALHSRLAKLPTQLGGWATSLQRHLLTSAHHTPRATRTSNQFVFLCCFCCHQLQMIPRTALEDAVNIRVCVWYGLTCSSVCVCVCVCMYVCCCARGEKVSGLSVLLLVVNSSQMPSVHFPRQTQ